MNTAQPDRAPAQPATAYPNITKHKFVSEEGVDFIYHVDHDQGAVFLEGKDQMLRFSGHNVAEISAMPLLEDSPALHEALPQPPYDSQMPQIPISASNDERECRDIRGDRLHAKVQPFAKENEERHKLDAKVRDNAQDREDDAVEGSKPLSYWQDLDKKAEKKGKH